MSNEEILTVICDKYCRMPYTLEEDELEICCQECPLNQLSNETQTEPTDAISRDAVWGIIMRSDFVDRFTYQEFTKKLDALPSVNPQEPKTGHWIEKDGFDGDVYYDCSECGESWTTIEGTPWDNEWNYCPNCGAKMESEEQTE